MRVPLYPDTLLFLSEW